MDWFSGVNWNDDEGSMEVMESRRFFLRNTQMAYFKKKALVALAESLTQAEAIGGQDVMIAYAKHAVELSEILDREFEFMILAPLLAAEENELSLRDFILESDRSAYEDKCGDDVRRRTVHLYDEWKLSASLLDNLHAPQPKWDTDDVVDRAVRVVTADTYWSHLLALLVTGKFVFGNDDFPLAGVTASEELLTGMASIAHAYIGLFQFWESQVGDLIDSWRADE